MKVKLKTIDLERTSRKTLVVERTFYLVLLPTSRMYLPPFEIFNGKALKLYCLSLKLVIHVIDNWCCTLKLHYSISKMGYKQLLNRPL